ncbi:MAG TPA: hypothetical protein VND99_00185 [Candidatus Acidoferrales bacterium]|nr:hypothetical protein [Candidatus Acidoferrales bacterium]
MFARFERNVSTGGDSATPRDRRTVSPVSEVLSAPSQVARGSVRRGLSRPRRSLHIRWRDNGDVGESTVHHIGKSALAPAAGLDYHGESVTDGEGSVTGTETAATTIKAAECPFSVKGLKDLRGPKDNQVNIVPIVRAGSTAVHHTAIPLTPREGATAKEVRAEARVFWGDLTEERSEQSAIFIEEVWRKVVDLRRDLVRRGRERGIHSDIAETSERDASGEQVLQPLAAVEGDFASRIKQLKNAVKKTYFAGAHAWAGEREARLRGLSQDARTPEDEAFVWFKDMSRFGHQNGFLSGSYAEGIIMDGIGTAINTQFNLFEAVPRVFEHQYGRLPNQQEAEELFLSTKPLAIKLAAGYQDLVLPLLFALTDFRDGERADHRFLREGFEIKEFASRRGDTSSIRRELAISDAIFEAVDKRLEPDPTDPLKTTRTHMRSVATRCSAMAAMGEGVVFQDFDEREVTPNNVVVETLDWGMDLARKHLIPTFPVAA